jgi:hypothetical protein
MEHVLFIIIGIQHVNARAVYCYFQIPYVPVVCLSLSLSTNKH